jgi:hypothetical protein
MMRSWSVLFATAILLLASFAGYCWLRSLHEQAIESQAPSVVAQSAPEPPTLPETAPPPELPIVIWGLRDSFPVIRTPWFVSARQGDTALADDEPVLGVMLDGEARAYSTNQLNRHEMVIDQIGDTPILVTY